jgi:hypothetical protein
MKLDPGMHIGLHLVFFGKSGVRDSLLPSGPSAPLLSGLLPKFPQLLPQLIAAHTSNKKIGALTAINFWSSIL